MKIKAQRNSPTLNLFARFVFRSDRKRAHGYAYVLTAALSHEVSPQNLPLWISQEGGIEEIKRKMVQSPEALDRKQKRLKAKDTAEQQIAEGKLNPLAVVSVNGFIPNEMNILLATGDINNNFNVTFVLNDVSDSLYNALVKQAAKKIVEHEELNASINIESKKFEGNVASNDATIKKLAA
jgi:hypothetical protein